MENKNIITKFVMLLSLMLVLVSSGFSAGGTGTQLDPFIINSCAELGSLTIANTDIYYELGNDIDCSSQSWTTKLHFYAQLDGKGYSIIGLDNTFITNLQANGDLMNIVFEDSTNLGYTNYNALVVSRNYGKMQYIGVVNSSSQGEDQTGILVGRNEVTGKIYYSYVKDSNINTHSGTSDYVGGLVGYNLNGGYIYESYADFTNSNNIVGWNYVGGLTGYNSGRIYDSYAKANVDGNSYVGVFAGRNYGASTSVGNIYDSYAVGTATGISNYHSFVGQYQTYSSNNGKIFNSYYDRQVSGDTSNYGAKGLLTIEMMSVKPFNGFEDWNFKTKWYHNMSDNDGYLSLRQIENVVWDNPIMLGTGVLGDEWQVISCEDLYEIDYDTNKLGGHFKLMNNISCEGVPQRPIGGNFLGIFNGQGFTISDTYIELFENIYTGAEVKNLFIENALLESPTTGTRGILARNNYGTIRNVFTNGIITTTGDIVGGLVGYNRAGGYIYNSKSYADLIGSIATTDQVGGLVGTNQNGAYIYESMSHNNNIQGNNYIGGFVGYNQGRIYDSYTHSPSIIGNVYIGGFVGRNYGASTSVGNIYNAYSIGTPSGNSNVGGFVGSVTTYSTSNGKMYQTFWDMTTSGTTLGTSYAIGKYSSDMKTIQTYSGSNTWDFDEVWYMDEVTGYPKLREMDGISYTLPAMVGDGSSGNPFQITTCNQIKEIQNSLTSSYILMNDVNCEETEMHRVGTFQGLFEGNNKVISGSYISLFDTINSLGTVRNLGIVNYRNSEDYAYQGVLVKYNDGGRISNVYVSGDIYTAQDYIGGLAGRNNAGVIEDSESYVNIYGNTAGSDYLGGLVGYNQGNGYIWRSSAKGNIIEGHNYIGGLVGYHRKGYIYDSFAKDVTVTAYLGAGGLIGYQYATSTDRTWTYTSYASGSIDSSTNTYEGGLAGRHYRQSTSYGNIINSYYDTETTGLTIGAGGTNAGVGLTTTQMKTQSSLTGLDFTNVWFMDLITNNGYANHQSFVPLVVVPFDVFINYPLNTEIITLNDSISDITLQYVHNSNSTNMICKQYIDGVLIDTRYNVGTTVQSITLNRWLDKEYLYNVQCYDGIITETKQHIFDVNVVLDLLGDNPNTNPNGGSVDINVSEIIDAINSLNLTVELPPQEGDVYITNEDGGTDIYHSYYTGTQYLNDDAQAELDKLEMIIIDPRTNETINTTGMDVYDITDIIDTLTLQDGTTFENVKPINFWNNILMKPAFEVEDKNGFVNWLSGMVNNLALAGIVFGGSIFALRNVQLAKKKDKWGRFKSKTLYVALLGAIIIFIFKMGMTLI